ncbi:unnamed protein product [Acanthosepion pharaonis]|uniref:Uncharacterized protein n=1 Tax=Acanthosepion pharaonis TaxID=158019 RepID=A0A812DN27_ACAPH|nr:unnamed protein product [Sepia pharaonis]
MPLRSAGAKSKATPNAYRSMMRAAPDSLASRRSGAAPDRNDRRPSDRTALAKAAGRRMQPCRSGESRDSCRHGRHAVLGQPLHEGHGRAVIEIAVMHLALLEDREDDDRHRRAAWDAHDNRHRHLHRIDRHHLRIGPDKAIRRESGSSLSDRGGGGTVIGGHGRRGYTSVVAPSRAAKANLHIPFRRVHNFLNPSSHILCRAKIFALARNFRRIDGTKRSTDGRRAKFRLCSAI